MEAAAPSPNAAQNLDFMHDVLATNQPVRVFTLVDVYSRECVALEVARSFSGADVARLLSDAGERTGALPAIIRTSVTRAGDCGSSCPRVGR